jgi:hypothetical protein
VWDDDDNDDGGGYCLVRNAHMDEWKGKYAFVLLLFDYI